MSRKLTLKLEALRVESFETDEAANVRGTVFGNGCASRSTCMEFECTCIPTEMSCDTGGTGGGGDPASRDPSCPMQFECVTDAC
jgi:hypothetical protein